MNGAIGVTNQEIQRDFVGFSEQYDQASLWSSPPFPSRARLYPRLRYMGSKWRLLPWIHEILSQYTFQTALDAFSGSGCVAYLMKAMGKEVHSNDFLLFPHHIAKATLQNNQIRLTKRYVDILIQCNSDKSDFVERNFLGIFFNRKDLRFLDNIWSNLPKMPSNIHRSLAISAITRSCLKKQPRGVFTVSGNLENYRDGRRDLDLSLEEHFMESVEVFNATVFDNRKKNCAHRSDVFDLEVDDVDLVYMDPPYVPRSDDNCYIKRYHFVEGLASYWREAGTDIMLDTKVRKIPKRYTPFSYRNQAIEAFEKLFRKFSESILVLSYSSNGYPDLDTLLSMMRKTKRSVQVFKQDHRYHFGTHRNVSSTRASVEEYLIVGTR